jgi:hypothetical protein
MRRGRFGLAELFCTMASLSIPITLLVIGEGGSNETLALASPDKLWTRHRALRRPRKHLKLRHLQGFYLFASFAWVWGSLQSRRDAQPVTLKARPSPYIGPMICAPSGSPSGP